MRIVIFADIHGKFLLPFKLVKHYQHITDKKIDWILQCGDMGAFPNLQNMDKATLRHAQNDQDELGFIHDFCQDNPKIRQFLDDLDINMLCVRGNHEDHAFLDALEQQSHAPFFAIDVYQRVFVCRSGVPIVLTSKNKKQTLSLVGVGRIGDHKQRSSPQFIQDYERQQLKKLIKNRPDVDILISHDKHAESQHGYGSVEIAELLNHIAFHYHFYGHTGEPFAINLAENGITQSVKIKELEFNAQGKLEQGCMLILEKQNENMTLEIVPLPKIIQFMKNTWRYYD